MKDRKLLIVEDEYSLRETWELMLSLHGIIAHTACNGSEAVKILQKHPVELVVTDLQMPIKDGYYVLDYIKSSDLDITTWVCTGHTSAHINDYDVDKIILKPFDMLSEVKEILSLINHGNNNV